MSQITELYVNITTTKFYSYFTMIRLFTLFYTIIISVGLFTFNAHAVEVNDLYQAQVAVESQSSVIRSRATKQAMRNVLVKVSGTEKVHQNTTLQQAINNPNFYLLQYRYRSINDERLLVVDFDENKINQLLNEAQQPIWGKLRPQLLLWLVEENGLVRRIYSSSDDSSIAIDINRLAKNRGLPVIQPLMDLDDFNQISVAELWGRFAEPVTLAGLRYSPEKNVIVRISRNTTKLNGTECALCETNAFVIDWSIIEEQKQTFSQPYQGNDITPLLEDLVNDITEHVYQQYALEVTGENEVFIDINNINNLTDYADVSNFLSTLSAIQQMTLVEVNNDYYRFKLTIMGSKNTLISAFKLSRQLMPNIDLFAENVNPDIPVFTWQLR